MAHGGKRAGSGRKKGSFGKATTEIRNLVQENVNFVKLIAKLEERAGAKSDLAARLLFEYGFGKAKDMEVSNEPGSAEEITRSFAEVVSSAGTGKAT